MWIAWTGKDTLVVVAVVVVVVVVVHVVGADGHIEFTVQVIR